MKTGWRMISRKGRPALSPGFLAGTSGNRMKAMHTMAKIATMPSAM